MLSVQLMCARLGMVTGRGLASIVSIRYPRWVLWLSCSLLIVANVFNIGADLAGMGEATEMITGVPKLVWTPMYAIAVICMLLWTTYKQIARTLKWLTFVLLAYIVTAFLCKPDWNAVAYSTFVPRIEFSPAYLATFVGLLGTTISPYLFFWQAAEMVEEERAIGRTTVEEREGATDAELQSTRNDVTFGMFVSNAVMFFIILTTASTLHVAGQTNISTAKEAAEALRPLAGSLAYLLFTIGIVGTGLLAVPVLCGSAAYAVCEAENWSGSLADRPRISRRFYGIIGVAMMFGLALVYLGIDAMKMLFYSAVLNGVLAPPLIVIVTLLTSNRKVMGERANGWFLKTMGWVTAAVMTAAVLGMLATI